MSVSSELIILNSHKTKLTRYEKDYKFDRSEYKSIDINNNYYKLGVELLGLLHDRGAVVFDKDNRLALIPFFENNKRNSWQGGVLGYLAEAIIVRNCNKDLSENRKWGNYARKLGNVIVRDGSSLDLPEQYRNQFGFQPLIEDINDRELITNDDYVAIGTGFASTLKTPQAWIYDERNPRDICWVHKNNDGRQLLSSNDRFEFKFKSKMIDYHQRFAGIQVKLSCQDNARYITEYFSKTPYYRLFPVVYFDLENDFDLAKNKLLKLEYEKIKKETLLDANIYYGGYSRDEILEVMLVRGKDIAPDLHDELLFYKSIFDEIYSGKIKIEDLTDENILQSLIFNYVSIQLNPSKIITVGVSG